MRALFRTVLLLLLTTVATTAYGDEEDPDVEIARRYFQIGSEHYSSGDYAGALREFEKARRYRSVPQLDFNIGRCLDRLERAGEAVVAYRRYTQAKPRPDDAATVEERIRVLEARIAESAPPAAPTPSPAAPTIAVVPVPPSAVIATSTTTTTTTTATPVYRRGWMWGVIAGVVVVGGVAVGVGVGVGSSSGGSSGPPASDGGNTRVVF